MKFPKFDLSMPAVVRVWHCLWRHLSLDHGPAQFACCRQQSSLFYRLYRWILSGALIAIGIWSFAGQRLPPRYDGPKVEIYCKWFIYFTNWGFMTIILQACLALWITEQAHISRNNISESRLDRRARAPALCRAYWLSKTIAADLAFVITVVYWTRIHNPKIHEVNAVNLLVHCGNSLVMLCELVLSAHPIRLAHALYSVAVGLMYGVFSAVYWALGGTDRFGLPAIYPALDWNHPGSALGFVAMCACVLLLAHLMAWLVKKGCACLAARVRLRRRPATLTLPMP